MYVATWAGFVYTAFVIDVFSRYTERLAEAGVVPSVGSVGDSGDNALAESINSLYKVEVIHRLGPWRNVDADGLGTLAWVDRLNKRRLFGPFGQVPPAEYERAYYGTQESPAIVAGLKVSVRRTASFQAGHRRAQMASRRRRHGESEPSGLGLAG